MSEAAAFEATYSDFRLVKGRKVVQFVFEVPIELADKAYSVLGGMPNPAAEVWVGVARLDLKVRNLEEHPHSTMQRKAVEGRPALDTNPARALNRYAQRAGILCNDPRFQGFLIDRYGGDDLAMLINPIMRREWTAQKVRQLCEVGSRAEILPNTPAANRLDILESAYLAECK